MAEQTPTMAGPDDILGDSTGTRYVDRIQEKSKAFTPAAFADFSHLNEDVRRHLQRVYLLLMFTVMACSVGSWVASSLMTASTMQALMLPIFFASFGIIIALSMQRSTPQNALRRSLMLVSFGFLQGIAVTPLILSVAEIDPTIPLKAFILTVAVFACFSMAALLCQDRRFLYLSGILGTALLGIFVLSILNIFLRSAFIDSIWLYGGLIVFSLFVAVDTQVIIERALRGDSDSVFSALDLFLDALNIFIRIMVILSRNKKQGGDNSMV